MFSVYFRDSKQTEQLVARHVRGDAIFQTIRTHVHSKNPNFNIFYIREWMEGDDIWCDVGSWCEFYIAKPEKPELQS